MRSVYQIYFYFFGFVFFCLPAVSQAQEYCTSRGQNTSYEWIAGIEVADLTNSSSGAGYEDYTNLEVALDRSGPISVTLTPGFQNGSYNEHWSVFIDLNQDGDFDDVGEDVYSNASTSTISDTFYIPADAVNGPTRMRVAMQYSSAPPSCGEFYWGEVEDYTVIIEGEDKGNLNYCTAAGNDQYYEWIAGVKVGEFENASNQAIGYEDFTEQLSGMVIPLSSETVTIRLTPGFSSGSYPENWAVWVDANGDGDFDDSGEEVYRTPIRTSETIDTTITLPEIAVEKTRLRVRLWYSSTAEGPCGTTPYGQVEDYTISAGSPAGELDTSFGTEGRVSVNTSGYQVSKILELQNGGILIGGVDNPPNEYDERGMLKLVALKSNGERDLSFGNSGIVFLNPRGEHRYDDWLRDMVLQDDGKILILAAMHDRLYRGLLGIFRLNPDGSFDSSFGEGGRAMLDLSSFHYYDIALQSDGRIVISGIKAGYPLQSAAVARVNSDGSLDHTFANNGEKLFTYQTYSPFKPMFTAVPSVSGEEQILLAYKVHQDNSNSMEIMIVSLNLDGSFNDSFNDGGVKIVYFTDTWYIQGEAAITSDGELLFGGKLTAISSDNFILRLDTTGALDESFGEAGMLNFVPDDNFGTHSDIAVQPVSGGEKILSVQWDKIVGTRIFRLTSDGQLDASFSEDGIQSVPELISKGWAASPRLAVTDNGKKLIVAGGDGDDLLVFRYQL